MSAPSTRSTAGLALTALAGGLESPAGGSRTRRVIAGIVGALLVVLGTPLTMLPAGPALADGTVTTGVTMTVQSVSSTTPVPDGKQRPLRIVLRVTNSSATALTGLSITGTRAEPINSQSALDAALKAPQTPDPQYSSRILTSNNQPVRLNVAPRRSVLVAYDTMTSTETGHGLCLCQNAVYPLYFVLSGTSPGQVLATAQTYVNSFGYAKPQPTSVSWLWPLVDRPHRSTAESTFIDDELAASVGTGRLRHMLDVVTATAAMASQPHLTLLIDPELIDELTVMRSGYQVLATKARAPVRGAGSAAAADWLGQLRADLNDDPNLEVQFTAPSDPNTNSLSDAGLPWTSVLSTAELARVLDALGLQSAAQTVAWPAGDTISTRTLSSLRSQGAATVVLPSSALTTATQPTDGSDFTSITTTVGPVSVAMLPQQVESWVGPALGADGAAALPNLVAEVAIRAVTTAAQTGTQSGPHTGLVLAAPRYLDPNVGAAVKAITATTDSIWASSTNVSAAAATVDATSQATLAADQNADALPAATLTMASEAQQAQRAIAAIQVSPAASSPTVTLPAAVQRAESNGWTTAPQAGGQVTTQLTALVRNLLIGVHIVKPSSGTYTLTSSNSPLPLTISNDLGFPVTVRIAVNPVNDIPGVSAANVDVRTIANGQTVTIKVPMKFSRSGRFQVFAQLETPSGIRLGDPVRLTIHSTALGEIGIVITAVAGGLLVLALLVRLVRRLRRRSGTAGTDGPVGVAGSDGSTGSNGPLMPATEER